MSDHLPPALDDVRGQLRAAAARDNEIEQRVRRGRRRHWLLLALGAMTSYGLSRDRAPVEVTMAGETRTVAAGALATFIDLREGVADTRGASATTTVGGRPERQAPGPPARTSRTPR